MNVHLNLTEEESEILIKLVTFVCRDLEDDLPYENYSVDKGDSISCDKSLSQHSAYFLSNAFRLVSGLAKKITVAVKQATDEGGDA